MDDGGEAPRLNEKQLAVVEKSLFELLRNQKSQAVPVELPVPSFWASVGQLLHHLETELAETIRDKGMGAEAQMKSRRLGNIRTCISDLTRLRLNAFTQNAVLSNLMKSPQGDAMSAATNFQSLDWQRHDSAERADGSEMVLTAGDVESCASLIAETLIAAGLAEPAPL